MSDVLNKNRQKNSSLSDNKDLDSNSHEVQNVQGTSKTLYTNPLHVGMPISYITLKKTNEISLPSLRIKIEPKKSLKNLLIERIELLGIKIIDKKEIINYLERFPEILNVLLQVSKFATKKAKNRELILQLFPDAEDDTSLNICVRQDNYDDPKKLNDLIEIINSITFFCAEKQSKIRGKANIITNTDFNTPEKRLSDQLSHV